MFLTGGNHVSHKPTCGVTIHHTEMSITMTGGIALSVQGFKGCDKTIHIFQCVIKSEPSTQNIIWGADMVHVSKFIMGPYGSRILPMKSAHVGPTGIPK